MSDWRAVLAVEGTPTGDGRLFDLGAFGWRDLPLTLLYMPATDIGHDGSFPIGSITSIERVPTGEGTADIVGEGDFAESDDPEVLAAIEMVRGGHQTGVSVDALLDLYMVAPFDEGVSLVDEDGNEVDEEEIVEAWLDGEEVEEPWIQIENVVTLRVQDATITAATVVSTPAFAEGMIEANAEVEAIAAGASLATPPAAWFANPRLERATPLTITPDGRVYGHLAAWGTCHIGMPGCQTPPSSPSNYAMFLLGERETDDGPVAVGQITLDTGHADLHLSLPQARAHYENTGAAVADVSAGEDPHGIWVAGALRPGLTEEQVTALRGAKLSGDWRTHRGVLEMVGALAVNIPGFPVPRGLMASGADADRAVAIVSAGTIRCHTRAARLAGRITHVRASGARQPRRVAPDPGPSAAQLSDLGALADRAHARELAALASRAAAPELARIAERV